MFLFLFIYFISTYEIARHSEWQIKALLFSFLMSSLPIFFLSLGRVLSLLFSTIFFILFLFNLYLIIHFDFISQNMLLAISGANSHEIKSMLFSENPVFLALVFFCICLIARASWKYAKFRPTYIIASLIFMIYPVVRIVKHQMTSSHREHNSTSEHILDISRHMPGYIGNSLFMIYMYFSSENQLKAVLHTKNDSMIIGKNIPKENNIILIIGESDISDRHNIYGYTQQNTTPNANRLQKNGKLCVIKNSHSSANMTRYAVPMIISFYDPDHQDKIFSEKNLIELARDNGYQTYWIASQDGRGPYARPFGYLSEFSQYVTRQDYNNAQNHVDWHDESILPVIKEKFTDTYKYKFFVIHIVGSHMDYEDNRTQEDINALPQADAYDQSIHRTDRIINEIINMADKNLKKYVLLYTSDHGEVVSDNKMSQYGHGLQYGGYAQYRIPTFLINGSDYCQIAENLKNKDGYFTETMDKFLLLDMMGYQVSPAAIKETQMIDHILHSDGKVYDYKNLPTHASE